MRSFPSIASATVNSKTHSSLFTSRLSIFAELSFVITESSICLQYCSETFCDMAVVEKSNNTNKGKTPLLITIIFNFSLSPVDEDLGCRCKRASRGKTTNVKFNFQHSSLWHVANVYFDGISFLAFDDFPS